MRRPPSLTQANRYPLTACVGVTAIIASIAWWSKVDMGLFFTTWETWPTQPWRLVLSVFPHIDVLHLVFNLYWLWFFGTYVEKQFGVLRAAGIYLFLAVGSSATEFAVYDGGVGLSGVGYGLFAMLWVLSQTRHELKEVIDKNIVTLFVGWFFLCLVLTWTNIWLVANVAHAGGAVFGALLGKSLIHSRGRRLAWQAALLTVFLTTMTASSVGRRYVNLSTQRGNEYVYRAYQSLEKDDYLQAIQWSESALQVNPHDALAWYYLGGAHHHLEQWPLALEAYTKARDLEPSNELYQSVHQAMEIYLASTNDFVPNNEPAP